jgi:hypothetical protein
LRHVPLTQQALRDFPQEVLRKHRVVLALDPLRRGPEDKEVLEEDTERICATHRRKRMVRMNDVDGVGFNGVSPSIYIRD